MFMDLGAIMNISKVTVEPEKNSITPMLKFSIAIGYIPKLETPITIDGRLLSEDNKLISLLKDMGWEKIPKMEIGATEKIQYEQEKTINLDLFAELSQEHLDYLEDIRSKHRKGNVVLDLEITVRYFLSKTIISGIFTHDEQPINLELYGKVLPIYYKYRHEFGRGREDVWLLSGEGGLTFLEVTTNQFNKQVEIPSSDWVHDYCPNLGIGRFVVIDIPLPEEISSKTDIQKKIKRAVKSANNASKNIRAGEWNQVIEDCRGVWELFKEQNDDELKELLRKDKYTEEAIEAFLKAKQNLFTFTSKFMHTFDKQKKKILPEIKACKEDAYFIYTTAMTLLNLLAKKSLRLNQ